MTPSPRPQRVLLVQPYMQGGVESLLSQEHSGPKAFGLKPPLGLLYIGTMLKERTEHTVKLIDAAAEELSAEDIAREVVDFGADVLGIKAETFYYYPACQIAEAVRVAAPNVHITFGGPHVGIYPDEVLAQPFVDSVVCGDGEMPIVELCNMLSEGELRDDVTGLHFKSTGVKQGPQRYSSVKQLESLPIIDRTLLKHSEYYGSVFSKSGLVTTMVTTRGCPERCGYCKLDELMKYSSRSAQSVVHEFRRLADLGYREIELYDDTFSISKRRVREICEGIIAAKLDVEWSVRDRVNTLDPKNLELMVKAGCRRVHFGLESGSDVTLNKMQKFTTTAKARKMVGLAREAGLIVVTHFMIGYLDETVEDMRKTLDFAVELNADYAEFSITIPLPDTLLYRQGIERGFFGDFWREFSRNPSPRFKPVYFEQYLTVTELKALRDEAVRRFYFRPSYVARRIKSLRDPSEARRQAMMGVELLRSIVEETAGRQLKGVTLPRVLPRAIRQRFQALLGH